MRLAILLAVLIGGPASAAVTSWPAQAQSTPCPTVTDWISILQVFITNPPYPISYSQWDQETQYLWTVFQNGSAQFFTGVPQNQVVGFPPWVTISSHHAALVQQHSFCPILTSNNTPLLTK